MIGVLAISAASDAALVVAFLLVCAAAGASAAAVVSRRRLHRRLSETVARLGHADPADPDRATTDDLLSMIESAVRDRMVEDRRERSTIGRLQEALDSLAVAVLVVDGNGEILERNISAGAFIEARHSDALVGAVVNELLAEAIAGRPAERTLELFGPPRRSVVVTTRPLGVEGARCAVAIVEDVTERRRLEAVRTDFVANISHELKTPIGAIGLLAETLQAEDDPDVAERLAGRIQMESYRVGRTIEDLLELSRIEIDETRVAESVELGAIVTEARDRLAPAAEQAGVTLSSIGGDISAGIRCDRRQLVSALTNLIDNAIKYSDPGNSVEVVAEITSDGVILSVTDHGIGIPARDIDRVFERFYRVDQARSRQTGGTGLGLAIVRHVAANHAGTVDVESRLGEGSSFRLCLPLSVVAIPENGGSTGSAADASNDPPNRTNEKEF
jgi:two-component system, OmpR family, sensor histidine kinase SenX3